MRPTRGGPCEEGPIRGVLLGDFRFHAFYCLPKSQHGAELRPPLELLSDQDAERQGREPPETEHDSQPVARGEDYRSRISTTLRSTRGPVKRRERQKSRSKLGLARCSAECHASSRS